MYDIITKTDYWQWLDDNINTVEPMPAELLKHIQDTFILSVLQKVKGATILEFGGGHSRILKSLSANNECWNVDKFEGADAGPKHIVRQRNVKTVKAFLGDFSDDIPSDYFDYVVSVSVVEHIPHDNLERVFSDCARVLKPGGNLVQAIDLYLPDAVDKNDIAFQFNRPKPPLYLKAAQSAGLTLKEPAAVDGDVCFRGFHASNSDATLYQWNSVAPKLRAVRERGQSVSLKAWWTKPMA